MRRWARLSQPAPCPDSPASPSTALSQPAQRAACRDSPSSRYGAVGPAHGSREVLIASGEVGRPGEQPQVGRPREAGSRRPGRRRRRRRSTVAAGSSRGRASVAPRPAARLGPSCPPRPRRRARLACLRLSTEPIFLGHHLSVVSPKSLYGSRRPGTHLAAFSSVGIRPGIPPSSALRCTHLNDANRKGT